jgi:nucleoside-diphosphate-sugar epimerase
MKTLWNADLAVNAVHVDDVCAAIVAAFDKLPVNGVFNLADESNLNQGSVS